MRKERGVRIWINEFDIQANGLFKSQGKHIYRPVVLDCKEHLFPQLQGTVPLPLVFVHEIIQLLRLRYSETQNFTSSPKPSEANTISHNSQADSFQCEKPAGMLALMSMNK